LHPPLEGGKGTSKKKAVHEGGDPNARRGNCDDPRESALIWGITAGLAWIHFVRSQHHMFKKRKEKTRSVPFRKGEQKHVETELQKESGFRGRGDILREIKKQDKGEKEPRKKKKAIFRREKQLS